MRKVTSATAAVALGVDRKILDNMLSREGRALLKPGRRGKSRMLSLELIERIAIAMVLHRDLEVSIAGGLTLAGRIAEAGGGKTIPIGTLGALSFDRRPLRIALEAALADALEQTEPPRRGRPPGKMGTKAKRGIP